MGFGGIIHIGLPIIMVITDLIGLHIVMDITDLIIIHTILATETIDMEEELHIIIGIQLIIL